MILLKATNEILQFVTTSTADINYSISFVDITTTTFTPSTSEGKMVTATTATVLSAPAASTQRQVKLVTISNRHASLSNTVTVKKDTAGTNFNLTPASTLLAGEMMQYMDGVGWVYYSVTGAIKGSQTAAGSTNQIQFNSGGVLAGDSRLAFDPSQNELILGGADATLLMTGITTEPVALAAGTVQVYAKAIVGKMQLKIKGPSGLDTSLQAALWQNNVVWWTPSVAAGVWTGTVGVPFVTGTNALALPTTTNLYTMMRRSTYANIVTTTNQTMGLRTELMFTRGNAAGLGGFMFVCRFGFSSIKTGMRAFVGLGVDTTAMVAADPSSRLNIVGFGFDLADTAWTFMHNDGIGTAIKETIPGQGTLATNNTAYDAYIWCAPNSSTVNYRLDRVDTGATLVDSSTSTDLPVNTTLLTAQCVMSNGIANIVAGDATLGINRMYIETDR